MVARAIATTHTCGYDAWAMYDDLALPTRPGLAPRRPVPERTEVNKEKAFSYAEYRALLDLFPAQSDYIRTQMSSFGFDPDDDSTDPATAEGMGNVCAKAVTDFRHGDGANQLGDLHPGAYTDYTGYSSVNSPDSIVDPNRWQPLRFCDGHGGTFVPNYVAPQWGNVTPFALSSWDQFHLGPPQRYPDGGYVAQLDEILRLNAHLDDTQKMIAEYWADGPNSELPPGHWTLFAEFVSRRDHHTFDEDVKMFFILGNAEMDAGIAVWGTKRYYDSERPITAIRFWKAGKKVLAYVPFHGPQVIDGADWAPYQPCSFVTPPFPEYPSGHSAFSAAGAEILERFSGSDNLNASVSFAPGSGRVEPGFAPAHEVTLQWATFSDAADQAGMSRRYGGIHFEQGDLDARKLGREVADVVWDKAQSYIHGSISSTEAQAKGLSATSATASSSPREPHFESIQPNPSAGKMRFQFQAPSIGPVKLTIYDVQGRRVASVLDGEVSTGLISVGWNGRDAAGRPVASGTYFAKLESAGKVELRKVVVTR